MKSLRMSEKYALFIQWAKHYYERGPILLLGILYSLLGHILCPVGASISASLKLPSGIPEVYQHYFPGVCNSAKSLLGLTLSALILINSLWSKCTFLLSSPSSCTPPGSGCGHTLQVPTAIHQLEMVTS